jgi:prophage antirepressor-like protein
MCDTIYVIASYFNANIHNTDARYVYKAKVLNPNATGKQRKTHELWMLTEPGLYRFLIGCRNKIAATFRDWIFFEVIPSIRRTGKYEVSKEEMKQLKANNKQLFDRLRTTTARHKNARVELKDEIDTLQDTLEKSNGEVKELKAELDRSTKELQELLGNQENVEGVVQQLRDKQTECARIQEQLSISAGQNSVTEQELTAANEDFDVVSDYLKKFGGMENVAAVLTNGYADDLKSCSNPMVNRNRIIGLRCAAFGILHTTAFFLVKGFQECFGRSMTHLEMEKAVKDIMEVKNIILTSQCRKNWITLYTFLARLARHRLPEGETYSTQMPMSHLYLYARNLNVWALGVLNIPSCVGYAKEIESFYGPDAVSEFDFEKLDYEDIQHHVESTQPAITNFFA